MDDILTKVTGNYKLENESADNTADSKRPTNNCVTVYFCTSSSISALFLQLMFRKLWLV